LYGAAWKKGTRKGFPFSLHEHTFVIHRTNQDMEKDTKNEENHPRGTDSQRQS